MLYFVVPFVALGIVAGLPGIAGVGLILVALILTNMVLPGKTMPALTVIVMVGFSCAFLPAAATTLGLPGAALYGGWHYRFVFASMAALLYYI